MKTLNVELKFTAPNNYDLIKIDQLMKYITDEWIYDILHTNDYKFVDYTVNEEK